MLSNATVQIIVRPAIAQGIRCRVWLARIAIVLEQGFEEREYIVHVAIGIASQLSRMAR
jgi:hypothetical protein